MILTADNKAKFYLALIAKLSAKLASIDDPKKFRFDFEPCGDGNFILNVYPAPGERLDTADGGTYLLEDIYERDAPARFLLTFECSEGDPATFWIVPSADDFDQKIDDIVAVTVPGMLN